MNTFSFIAIITAVIAVTGVLVLGLLSMVKGGEFNKKHGNKLMQARVILQGLAVALLALAYFSS